MWIPEFLMQNAALILDGLLALGLVGSVCLSLGAQRAIQRLARKHRKALDDLGGKIAAASAAPVMSRAPQELQPETVSLRSASSGVRPMLNLNQRVQALRLLRRGQDIGHVSAVLGMTRKEIELLIRVQELAAARTAGRPV